MQAKHQYGSTYLERGFLMAETFADYVKRYRTLADMKQTTLAEKVGISQAYVSGIERGINKDVDPATVAKIAEVLGRPADEAVRIVYPSGPPQPQDDEVVLLRPNARVKFAIPGVGNEEYLLTEDTLKVLRGVMSLRGPISVEPFQKN